uniref:Methionine aminopeptidase n=1 Tax=Aureoumbra lagunensis TaxID=44058 RepID=A0A7S3K4P0_9STRA|mmetsp:Transcript_13846/g.20749  ORF Transcript_13846/g.20749 Transcript_13846/m.20749 type:complete len:284 (-) Transcript_13846:771-1622(-)
MINHLVRRRLRTVPAHIPTPSYACTGKVGPSLMSDWSKAYPHDDDTIEKLRIAGSLAREMLDLTCSLAEPGITTNEIDAMVHDAIIQRGAYPAPLNYMGFPKSICASNNDELCHGIPNDKVLEKGDLISFDVSLFYNGVFGDNCATILVGGGTCDLLETTQKSLETAVQAVGPGINLTVIGDTIQRIADAQGFGVNRQFCGHGIGTIFHAPPLVQHYRNHDSFILQPGHVFTIEPILTENGTLGFITDSDGWTVRTKSGERAAQFEHMVLITPHGRDILTTVK